MHLLNIARRRRQLLRHDDAVPHSSDLTANPASAYFLGASQASVTALSIRCRCSLWHCGQVKVRRSWPSALGSIAVNFIGEPQAVHCGPWFWVSSMVLSCSARDQRSLSALANRGAPSRRRGARDGLTIMLRSLLEWLVNTAQI
jgi:hypothetical protein